MTIRKVFDRAEVAQALHEEFDLKNVGDKVLEIGFGKGEIIAQFLEYGYKVWGIEKSISDSVKLKPSLISAGIQVENLDITTKSLEDFDFSNQLYAVIICQNVLHFVEKNLALTLLDKMLLALLPGGFLWLVVHHSEHINNDGENKYFISFFNEGDIEPVFENKVTIHYKAKCWKPQADKSVGLNYLVRKDI